MVKMHFLVVVVLLASLLMVGCGIPQEDYDAVVAERDTTQRQVEYLQTQSNKAENDLTEAQTWIESLESDVATTQSQLLSLQTDLTAAQNRISYLQSDLGQTEADLDKLEEQIAMVSSVWSSLEPKVKISLYLHENAASWCRYRLKEITNAELTEQTGDQWEWIAVCLKAIGNDELTENMRTGWYETNDKKKDELWSVAYSLLISLTEEDIESLSNELTP